MNSFIALLIRQALAAFAGTLAAQGITVNADSTASLLTALIIFAVSALWSWIVKLKWSTDSRTLDVIDDSTAGMLRKALGSLVSQGVAAFSGYLATQGHVVNVEDPVALSLFGANVAASKLGLHQKLAFTGAQDALKTFAVLGSLFAVCSCTTPQRQLVVSLTDIGLALAQSRGVIQEGDKVLIGKSVALILDDEATTRDKVVRLTDLGVQAAVDRGTLQEGDALLIRQATAVIERALPQTSAKQPNQILPQIQGGPQIASEVGN
jgi:hypothetical protein